MLALAERQASDGWFYLPGGLLWRRVAGDGSGARPTVDDTVTLHYVGTLVDGTEFDSSVRRGQPATFPLRGLIPAWQLAVPHDGVGDTIEIAAPADLAYGPIGRGPIPGGATLLFRIAGWLGSAARLGRELGVRFPPIADPHRKCPMPRPAALARRQSGRAAARPARLTGPRRPC